MWHLIAKNTLKYFRRGFAKLSYCIYSFGFQDLLCHLSNSPYPGDRQRIKNLLFVFFSDNHKSVWLIQIGGKFCKKLIGRYTN